MKNLAGTKIIAKKEEDYFLDTIRAKGFARVSSLIPILTAIAG